MEQSPKFYQYYPMLFESYFNFSNRRTLKMLSKAGYHYYHAVLCLDSIIDDSNFNKIPQMLALQEESIKLLATIYGIGSPFWNFWSKRKEEYYKAIEIEKSLTKKENIHFSVYEDLADKKSAFGKVAIDSLFVLDKGQDKDTYKDLLLSHKYFSVGFQLYDDVKDFKEDFISGQFNFAIHQLRKVIDFKQCGQDVDTLNKLLFIKNVGQNVLAKSIEQFEKAVIVIKRLKVRSKWLETVTEMKSTIEGYLDVTYGYLATIKARLDLKNQKSRTHSFFEYTKAKGLTLTKALDFVKTDFKQNYADLKHIMYLGQSEGFENDTQVHISDTFQRALINDCYINVANACNVDITDFLKNECNYLIKQKNVNKTGGWSYFPTVKEIAADIDDLGQMIQLFALSGNRQFIDKYCKKAISIALNERMLSNGGIETWIIPKENQTQIQKRQEHFNVTKWGKGPDVEVVANFIYALTIFDKERYNDVIEKSISFILGKQKEKGYWESRWYYGNYYGTYACLRLLKEFERNFPKEIQKALNYLTHNQNEDGGFSIKEKEISDPLSTAFAVLSLKLYPKKNKNAIVEALSYLRDEQSKDGSWEAVNFIRPKVHEPYKSKTLTTAYALKALYT